MDSSSGFLFSSNEVPQGADLVCFSHLRWDFVTQRPQHLLRRAARDRRVFFWEEPFLHASERLPKQADLLSSSDLGFADGETPAFGLEVMPSTEKNIFVLRPHLLHSMTRHQADVAQERMLQAFLRLANVRDFISWYYTPMARAFTQTLQPAVVVYDCMDELSAFSGAPPELVSQEQDLLAAADVVFTGGVSLFEAKRQKHRNVHAFPSSVDVEHFGRARQGSASLPQPDDQSEIPHPRAGFFGVIDERFDVELLAAVAKLRPEVHFVLLGPVVKIDSASLPTAANLHFLGGKAYEDLPAYLAGWDAALLPFARNEATRFISPTKTPEYLAAGKPVVSTSISDVVRDYGVKHLAFIADTPDAFVAALDEALLPPSPQWLRAVDEKLATMSWDRTWAGMDAEIRHVLNRKAATHPSNSCRTTVGVLNLNRTGSLDGESEFARSTSFRAARPRAFDYIVAGAGFAGAVLAERIATELNKRVLVVDRRDHIAGNAFDFYDAAGILVHKYGPHIFHTNSEKVFRYLSRFTEWRPYEHRVLASVDGRLVPLPINIDTVNQLYGLSLDAASMREFLHKRAVPVPVVRTSRDIVLSRVGEDLYEKLFRNYTRKQWGLDASELDAGVAGRIPVRFNHDDRYFSDTFQAMPARGYTAMFERMLDHPNITIRTGVDFSEVGQTYRSAKHIFTGPIDEYFDFQFGPLPYRSLRFRHETFDRPVFQPAPVVNFPNEHAYTRVTEFKYLTGQQHARTSVVFEYPESEGDPYYPIPRPENAAVYMRYKALADRQEHVSFCGRLANYKYLNMDQVVASALTSFEALREARDLGRTLSPELTQSSSERIL